MAENKEPTWKVSSKLRSNARALRKNSTDAERILWSELRDHRLNGARAPTLALPRKREREENLPAGKPIS